MSDTVITLIIMAGIVVTALVTGGEDGPQGK